MTDPLADMLTQIRNAQSRSKATVRCPASRLRRDVLGVLKKEGYVQGFKLIKENPIKPQLEIALKYFEGGGVISELQKVSKPGRRIYTKAKAMPQVYSRLGIFVLSTSKGVMSDLEARKLNIGGEILCRVF